MTGIRLFDAFHMAVDGEHVVLPYRQAEAALVYLLVSHPKPVGKDLLAELLWPARPPGVARGNLRHAVHTLRSAGGLTGVVASTRNDLCLERLEGIRCDYLHFQELVAADGADSPIPPAAVREAIRLYGNGLLESFGAEPSREYGLWLHAVRRSCAKRLFSFLFAAVPGLCGRSEEALTAEIAEFLVQREPYDTGLYEFLLRSLISRGKAGFADRLHRGVSGLMEKGGEREAMDGLSEIARRIFPRDSYPVKRRLPPPLLPFVGRREELMAVEGLLRKDEARLVTITAPGGYGKTSLALGLARELDASAFPDGIFFIPLCDCRDGNAGTQRLLSALDLSPGGDAEETLVRYLGDKRLLLLFDELENAPFAAALIDRLLGGCAGTKILSTSRRELGLNAEWVYRLPPFATRQEARELFTLTAERKTGKTDWTGGELRLAEEICRAVDGIPLAIELVASRTMAADGKALSRLLAHLTEGSVARMGNMERILEYQVSLLAEPGRRQFPLLSLFHDCFDREEACRAFGIDEDAFDGFCRLSLVWPFGKDLFRLHAHVRSWCRSRLRQEGGFDPGFRRLCAHLTEASHRHFLRLFSLMEDPLELMERYPVELENAWVHSLGRKDWDAALKIAIPLGSYLHYHGMVRTGRELFRVKLDELLAADSGDLPPAGYHAILQIALICAVLALQVDEVESGLRILAAMRRLDRRSGQGFLTLPEGLEDPYRRYLSISFPWVEGIYALRGGNREGARGLFVESRRRAVVYSAHLCRVYVEIHLAMLESEGNPGTAMELLESALKTSHGRSIPGIRSEIFLLMARICLALGRTEEAETHAETVLKEDHRRPASRTEMEALFLLALLHMEKGTDREIPRVYLLQALEAARKNGLFPMAVDSSLAFIRRWIGCFGEAPDWQIYETVSILSRGEGLKKRKEELDRLFGLA